MLTLIIIIWVIWALCRPWGWHRLPMGGFHGGHVGGFGGGFGGGGHTMGGGAGRGRR